MASLSNSNFFSAANRDAAHQREKIAFKVMDIMLDWLKDGGDLAVFDATNTTRKRRQKIIERCQGMSPLLNVLFLESICDDDAVLHSNMINKAKHSPDYEGMPLEIALADLAQRIENYAKIYESIDDDRLSYIKVINLASKVICNQIHGRLPQLIATFLVCVYGKICHLFESSLLFV
jgi:hypothetical protein